MSLIKKPSDKLSVMSYNVWFDHRDRDTRVTEIINLCQRLNPSVICLQEVTHQMYTTFADKLGNIGYMSSFKDSKQYQKVATSGYGVVIFSKIPLVSVRVSPFMKTKMGRYFIIAKLQNGINIITTHLESMPQYAETRQEQIRQIMEIVPMIKDVIWTMDSNLTNRNGDTFPENSLNDCYHIAGSPATARFTYDAKTNSNILNKYQSRLDRIYYQSSKLAQTKFELTGNYNIPTTKAPPSDHYGILAEFDIINDSPVEK